MIHDKTSIRMISVHYSFVASLLFGFLPCFLPFSLFAFFFSVTGIHDKTSEGAKAIDAFNMAGRIAPRTQEPSWHPGAREKNSPAETATPSKLF
jgi:hypothetical protein